MRSETASPSGGVSPTPPAAIFPVISDCRRIIDLSETAQALRQDFGIPLGCVGAPALVLDAPGGGKRGTGPGFLVCQESSAIQCGEKPEESQRSYIANWSLYPFPTSTAVEVGSAEFSQQYQCVADALSRWTFHFETLTFTTGCPVPPQVSPDMQPCAAVLWSTLNTIARLVMTDGKVVSCSQQGSRMAVAVNGNPVPGILVCDAGSAAIGNSALVKDHCGLALKSPGAADVWQFSPLPVSQGPVDSATFDTTAGTACVTAAGRPFTFTLATRAFTPGCGAAPSVTPAVEATTTP